jgi:hypothetical protein
MEAKAGLLAYELTNNDVPLRVVRKLIKQALVKLYGRKNVKVRKEGYGWIDIDVKIERPHEGECMKPDNYHDYICEKCRNLIDTTIDDIQKVIDMSGLAKHIFLSSYVFNLDPFGLYVSIRCYEKL